MAEIQQPASPPRASTTSVEEGPSAPPVAQPRRASRGFRLKIGVAAALALLAIIVAAQNTASVETKVLFLTVTMPRAVLLATTLLTGVAVGLIGALFLARRK